MKINLSDITFLIPIRLDSIERLENLKIVTDTIFKYFITNIHILEASVMNNHVIESYVHADAQVYWIQDDDPVFHRTKYINQLVVQSKTPLLAIWDSDVLVRPEQIDKAVRHLRANEADVVFPYGGFFLDTGFDVRKQFFRKQSFSTLEEKAEEMVAPYGSNACGGGFIANKEAYQNAGIF